MTCRPVRPERTPLVLPRADEPLAEDAAGTGLPSQAERS